MRVPMLGQFSILLVSLFFIPSVIAANDQIQPLAKSSLLLDIVSTGSKLVAVGERGHVLLQKEEGWQQVSTPVDVLLTKVFFLDKYLGWAVGHDASIIHTRDGGQSWQLQMQSVELEKPFLDILFFNAIEGIAVGAYGLFYRTDDGGQNWQEEFHHELLFAEDVSYLNELKQTDKALYFTERAYLLPHFNRIIPLDDGRLLLVGELGLVAVSLDQGKQFEMLDFIYDGSMFNSIETSDSIYVMGLQGKIFRADKGFIHWQSIPLSVTAGINGAVLDKQNNLWFVGNAGTMLKMTAKGEISQMRKRQGENITAVAQDPFGKLWMTSTEGVVLLEE